MRNNELCNELQESNKKISYLEEKNQRCWKPITKRKTRSWNERKMETFITEIEDDFKKIYQFFLWFILQEQQESNCTSVYSPKFGSDTYNETFTTVCLKTYSIN